MKVGNIKTEGRGAAVKVQSSNTVGAILAAGIVLVALVAVLLVMR